MEQKSRLQQDLQAAGMSPRVDEPLAKRTWWRVGGSADVYVDVPHRKALGTVQRVSSAHDLPVTVLGNGSNILVSDAGIRGVVVRLTDELAQARALDSQRVRLGGGAKLVSVLRHAMREGWTGLEMLAGVPGTVGGAVKMNAGTRLGEIGDRLIDATLVLRDGTLVTMRHDAMGLAYRSSALPAGAIVAEATLSLTDEDPAVFRERVQAHLDYRAQTQPVDVPTCGSTFRNPQGDHAARLIEAAGLKGFAIGAARVSQKHANFLVNEGGATAADLAEVIDHVRATVLDVSGVSLVPEVDFVGEWPDRR